jgi:hypothetical protein
MKKDFYFIPQPPLTDKFNFLVDDLGDKLAWGHTADITKINYNRSLLGDDFNEDLREKMKLAKEGMTLIFPIGRYITILQLRADEKQGAMTFMDYQIELTRDGVKSMLLERFSEDITNEWLKHYDKFQVNFDEEDNVVLYHYKAENFLDRIARDH